MTDSEETLEVKREKYAEKFKDPRWQKLRLKVFQRDEWTCQKCYGTKETLHVHHRYYSRNKEPWEYPLEALVTLCEECHGEEKQNRPGIERSLLFALREKFLAEDVSELAIGFHMMLILHAPEVVASVYGWALQDEKIQRELIDRYSEHLKERAGREE